MLSRFSDLVDPMLVVADDLVTIDAGQPGVRISGDHEFEGIGSALKYIQLLLIRQMIGTGKFIEFFLMAPPFVLVNGKALELEQKRLERSACAFGDRLVEIFAIASVIDTTPNVMPVDLVIGIGPAPDRRHYHPAPPSFVRALPNKPIKSHPVYPLDEFESIRANKEFSQLSRAGGALIGEGNGRCRRQIRLPSFEISTHRFVSAIPIDKQKGNLFLPAAGYDTTRGVDEANVSHEIHLVKVSEKRCPVLESKLCAEDTHGLFVRLYRIDWELCADARPSTKSQSGSALVAADLDNATRLGRSGRSEKFLCVGAG